MKTYRNLFVRIASFDNLLLAAKKAQKGKRFKESTARFNLDFEKELLCLNESLIDLTYRHGAYRDFFVYDPKMRLISAAPYRDRVVHHALCNVIEPLFDRTFIHDSYACRKGKGTHAAAARYSKFSRKNNYVLKCDIRKYFQSIDHEILIGMLSAKIKCERTLWLIREIIGTRQDHSFIFHFPGDDLFSPLLRKKGIPIGNLTSQFFANVYLNGFDHFVKEELRCEHYIRYVDDFVVLENSRDRLHGILKDITEYLDSLRLKLHARKCRIYRTEEGVRFLGYRMFPTHRLLRKDNALRMRRRLKQFERLYSEGAIAFGKIDRSIQSWIGHASHADTFRLRERLFDGVVFQRGGAKGPPGRLMEQQSGERPVRLPQQEQPR